MNDAQFTGKIIEVLVKLGQFRLEQDASEKRILRDKIRAVVKELTRV